MFAVVSVLIVIADRITKIWIDSHMALGETRPLFGKLAQLCYIHNSGAAFSMLEGKQTLLIGLTAAVMIGIIVYVSVYKKKLPFIERFSLALITGGGFGNLICRVLHGYVIDFIDIHFIPVFNVADIAITIGCVLFCLCVLLPKKK